MRRQSPWEQVFAEIERDGLRIVHFELEVFQDAGFDALHFFLVGRLVGNVFDGLEQDLARVIDRLVGFQA